MRQMAKTVKPEYTWTQDEDGTIHIHTETTLKSSDVKFKLGEEFDDKRVDGEVSKVRSLGQELWQNISLILLICEIFLILENFGLLVT